MNFTIMNMARKQALLKKHGLGTPLGSEELAYRLLTLELRLDRIETRLLRVAANDTMEKAV